MLFKSMNLLKSSFTAANQQHTVATLMGVRSFSSKTFSSGDLSDNFSFPKHKEFFND